MRERSVSVESIVSIMRCFSLAVGGGFKRVPGQEYVSVSFSALLFIIKCTSWSVRTRGTTGGMPAPYDSRQVGINRRSQRRLARWPALVKKMQVWVAMPSWDVQRLTQRTALTPRLSLHRACPEAPASRKLYYCQKTAHRVMPQGIIPDGLAIEGRSWALTVR